jgi:hypothetical protein
MKPNFVVLTLIAFVISCDVNGQSFSLPKGYKSYKDFNGKEQRVDNDFDGDGLKDMAIVCEDNNDQKIIAVYLASKLLIDKSYWWFPWNYNSHNLSYANNVLTIKSDDDYDFMILKLKYYSKLKNMKLIGYSRTYYLQHPQTLVGSNSINLNTGEYSVNGGPIKKIDVKTITLSDIEKYFDYLSKVGGVFPE